MEFIHQLFFAVYPYVVVTTFILGNLIRFDRDQYTWKADSSQIFERKTIVIASPMFHVGIIMVLLGHGAGLLIPHKVFLWMGVSDVMHQWTAISAGLLFGCIAWVGGFMLLKRRLFNERVRAASHKRDIFVLVWIMLTLTLGLLTIPFSIGHVTHGNAATMIALADWVQSLVILQPNWQLLLPVGWVFKIHLIFGLTFLFIFPFTRLVHALTFPAGYYFRPYQVVRSKNFKSR